MNILKEGDAFALISRRMNFDILVKSNSKNGISHLVRWGGTYIYARVTGCSLQN